MTKQYTVIAARYTEDGDSVMTTVLVSEEGGAPLYSRQMVVALSTPEDEVIQTLAEQWVQDNPDKIANKRAITFAEKLFLSKRKVVTALQDVARLILNKYPEVEQKLWNDYEKESQLFDLENPELNNPNDFPNLLMTNLRKLGLTDNVAELQQRLATDVASIRVNAVEWRQLATNLSGIRSKAFTSIDACPNGDEGALNSAILAFELELEQLKQLIEQGS